LATRIGNAPVSFGAWSSEAARHPSVPSAERVLTEVAAAGYDGIELGPLGYLPPERIAAHELELAGAYVGIPFGAGQHDEWGDLDATLDVFDAIAPDARPILADDGDPDAPLDYDDVMRAVAHARARDYEPTFHHHLGTRVETRGQIEALLERVDVPLLLDTGHLLTAGVDPVAAYRDWRDRIDYVHVKDADLRVLREAPDWPTAWRSGVFCELGTGDVDLAGFLAVLDGYAGWIVVEHDWVPRSGDDPETQLGAQHRNRQFLLDLRNR
jgi:inosose dehydratase